MYCYLVTSCVMIVTSMTLELRGGGDGSIPETGIVTTLRRDSSSLDLRRQSSAVQQQHHQIYDTSSSAVAKQEEQPHTPLRRQHSLNTDTRRKEAPLDERRGSVNSDGASPRRDSRIAVHDGKDL